MNRVFDSSGPEGKVRGTPQQIIEKYQQLTRDCQLSGDRVAAENFQQHAEHYMRLQAEAQREIDSRREQQDRENREKQAQRDQERNDRPDRQDESDRSQQRPAQIDQEKQSANVAGNSIEFEDSPQPNLLPLPLAEKPEKIVLKPKEPPKPRVRRRPAKPAVEVADSQSAHEPKSED